MPKTDTFFGHMQTIYKELEDRTADGSDVFVGSKVEAYRATGLPQTYYSELFYYLTELGCILQIQRGNNRQSSIIQLIGPPIREAFDAQEIEPFTSPSLDIEKMCATLSEDVRELEERLAAVEARLDAREV